MTRGIGDNVGTERSDERDTPTLLYDAWYPIARSVTVRHRPVEARLLGRDLVIFRDRRGRAQVLAARCPHRGGNLSRGRVVDDCVVCPYHQWQYDGTGACVAIPTMPPKTRIPRAARVHAFPAVERQGLIWTCVGDRARAPSAPPSFVGLSDPTMHVFSLERRVPGPFEWWVENLIDMQHVPSVHASLYARQDPALTGLTVDIWPDERGFTGRAIVRENPSIIGRLIHERSDAFELTLTVEHTMPGVTNLQFDLGRGKLQDLYFFTIPESEERSRIFQFVGRNYMVFPGLNRAVDVLGLGIAHLVLQEDIAMSRNALTHLTVHTRAPVINLDSDAMVVAFARLMRLWHKRESESRAKHP